MHVDDQHQYLNIKWHFKSNAHWEQCYKSFQRGIQNTILIFLFKKIERGGGGGYVNENLGIANTQIPKSQIRLAVWSEEVADKETEPEWLLLQNNPCAVANRLNSSWQEINPAQKKLLTLHCMLMCVQWLDCSVKRLSLLLHRPQRSITQQRSASTEKHSRA